MKHHKKKYSASEYNRYNKQKMGAGSIIQKVHFSEADTEM